MPKFDVWYAGWKAFKKLLINIKTDSFLSRLYVSLKKNYLKFYNKNLKNFFNTTIRKTGNQTKPTCHFKFMKPSVLKSFWYYYRNYARFPNKRACLLINFLKIFIAARSTQTGPEAIGIFYGQMNHLRFFLKIYPRKFLHLDKNRIRASCHPWIEIFLTVGTWKV